MSELRAIVGLTPGSGHGECFVWKGASGTVVAVDAGGAESIGQHAGAHNPEILILSHDDSDHIRGAVALINSASGSLRELWIPAEWAILIKQIAATTQNFLLPDGSQTVSVAALEAQIADGLVTTPRDFGEEEMSARLLALAATNVSSWDPTVLGSNQGFRIAGSSRTPARWYGAKDLDEIVKRVRSRAKALIAILSAARMNSVTIRLFSIDLALASLSKTWEKEGEPGTATLANASEANHALAISIPAGLAFSYALTRITVQNRRALCTLLWSKSKTLSRGAIIWSDTDGNWLDHASPLGLNRVLSSLSASSAPHHASANIAHDRVWQELGHAAGSLVMISAGGQIGQSYRPEYDALKGRRCCTWCRPASSTYQEVRVTSIAAGAMKLHDKCASKH